MKHYKLFIDESGHSHQNHPSKYFVLVGCIVEDAKQDVLKIKADQLKYKYWNKTDIVFHSEEIGKRVGAFKQFAGNSQLAKQFEKQLLQYLRTTPILVTAVIVDKAAAYKARWSEETIIKKASEALLKDFLAFLYGNKASRGRVVYESAGVFRDSVYLKSFNYYLDPNWERVEPDFTRVREHLTSITFANKLNDDTEMQLADLISYGVVCKFKKDKLGSIFHKDSYEAKLISVLEERTVRMPSTVTDKTKKAYHSKINGVSYLPIIEPRAVNKKRTA